MSDRLSLLVSSLSGPPGSSGSAKALLPHRELPGWAVQRMTGCVADASLLLIADELAADVSWADPPWGTDNCFHDDSGLVRELSKSGRVRLFDGHAMCTEARASLDAFSERALGSYRDWLSATSASARDWEAQSDLIAGVWESTQVDAAGWRDMLRGAGMSLLRHNFRNQTQAVTALLTLIDWQPAEEMDPELLREAFSSEVTYMGCLILAANRLATGLHDWNDLLALYRRLLAPDAQEPVSFRMPGISASDPESAMEILTGPGAEEPRGLVAAAIRGDAGSAADLERALLAAVPRERRTPYVFREISIHRFDPERLGAAKLPDPGPLFLSRWRSALE